MISHIGFIMDGNRRYGEKQNLSNTESYRKGLEKFLEIVSFQVKYNINETSFFALSNDNYIKRTGEEKDSIAEVLKFFVENEKVKEFFTRNKILIKIKGNISEIEKKEKLILTRLGSSIKKLSKIIEEWNSSFEKENHIVNLAINYDGQKEILRSVKRIATQLEKGEIKKGQINEKLIKKNLWFNDSNPPEVIVRTGDAPRLSGFLLWDSEYSEIFLTKKLWPELDETDFLGILDWYKNIERNFGK